MSHLPAWEQEIVDACFHPSGDFIAFAAEDVEQSIPDRFERIVREYPGRLALKASDREFTYLGLNRAANPVARAILERSERPDEPVAVLFEHGAGVVPAILGVLKAHKFYVPVDPSMPRERLCAILADCGAATIVTNTRNFDLANALAPSGTVINADDLAGGEDNVGLSIPATAREVLFYTSGSTGRPKGVLYNHRSMLHDCMFYTNSLHLCVHDRLTMLRSCHFAGSMHYLWGALLNGAGLYVYNVQEEGLGRLARWLRDEQITLYHQGVAEFRYFVDTLDDEEVFSELRVVKLGSQQATRKDLVWFKRHTTSDCVLMNTFNSTEAGSMLFYLANHEMASSGATIPLGFPVDDMKITLRDERGAEVAPGEVGEIAAQSDYLSAGYWQQPELTRAKFLPPACERGPRTYLTGDLGRCMPDGCFEYVGRTDFRVKIRGYTVEPSQVETRLMEHPGISEAAVVARDDPYGQSRLVGYCVAGSEPAPNAGVLHAFLRETLPEFMVPARFIMLETMPLTANGKFDRGALPVPEESRPELDSEFLPPRTATEKQLANIWARVLGVEPIGVNDHFLELGGHSLAATQVISRIRANFQLDLPFTRLFETPRIGDLAQWLDAELAGTSGGRTANRVAAEKRPAQRAARGTQPIARIAGNEPCPASFAQQRLWFLDQLIPENPVYNEAHHMLLQGSLDIAAFRRSLCEIVRRHETLRTSFIAVDGKPFQVVAARDEDLVELPFVDLTVLEKGLQERVVRDLARVETNRIFDLGKGPLLRTALLRLSGREHVWLLTLHHIVADGWSMEVLMRELAALYQAFSTRTVAPLPELPIQYRDFAVWQREQLRAAALEAQLGYWRQQLEGAPTEPALPVDRPRPAVQTNRGERFSRTLPRALSEDLKKLSRREGVTPFMTLLAAFQTLLYRYSGQEDILVGTPVASRNRIEIEGLIGFFVNMLVLRTDLSGAPSFQEVLERVRRVVLDAQSNQDLPAEKLLEELHLEREMSRTPLTQVAFAFREPQRNFDMPGLTLSRLDLHPGTAKTDLILFVSDESRGLTAAFEYNTDLFEAATIEGMLDNFQALLESVVEDPERRIAMLPPFLAGARFDGQNLEAIHASSNLTRNQLLIWLGQKLDPRATTYNIGFAVELPRTMDWQRFRRATQRLIDGCDALRTVIRDVHGVPEQRVLARLSYDVPLVDLSGLPSAAQESRARAKELCQLPFAMEERLFESVLFKRSEEAFLWYVGMHHIIADGWSVWLLGRCLSELYERDLGGTGGEAAILPAFREYVRSEAQHRRSPRYLRAAAYWEQKLSTEAEPLSIYGNAPSRTTRAKRLSFELGPERTRNLRVLARREAGPARTLDALVFEVFVVLVCAYLTRAGAGRRLCLGTPFHNRRTKRAKETIGSFLEVLPLRVMVDESDTFESLRAKVRGEISETMRHSRYTVSNREGMNYDVLVNYQLVGKSDFAGTPLTAMEWLHPGTQDLSMAFQLYDFARSDSLELSFDFQLEALNEQQEERAVGHFLRLVDALIENPGRSIKEVNLLTSEELDFFLRTFNPTAAREGAPRDFMGVVESQAEQTPDRMAVRGEAGALTYGELNTRANQLAHYLRDLGVGADVPVGLCLKRDLDAVIGVLGILKAGGCYVPLDLSHPRERMRSMVRNGGVSVILTQAETKEAFKAQPAPQIVCVDETRAAIGRQSKVNPSPAVSGDNLVYVIHTSGSTGEPKGTGVHRRGFSNLLEWFVKCYGITGSDSLLLITSLGFDLSQKNLFAPLMCGGTLHLYPEGYDPREIIRAIAEQEISWLNCTPSAFYPLVEQGSEHHAVLASLRYLFLGGEPILASRLREWIESEWSRARVVNTYGPTECTDITASFVVPDARQCWDRSIPLGRPIWRTQLYVLDPELRLEPMGVLGELCIAGEGVGRGYLKDSVRTAAKFVPNPLAAHPGERLYRSGDVAHHMGSGELEFLGRMDHQVKIRGFRIELGEIEAVLEEHPGVREAVVVARQEQRLSEIGERRTETDPTLTAYVCARLAEEGDAGWQAGYVDQWQALFEDTYRRGFSGDRTFDTSGWNSSYTGQPIPADEMLEWVEAALQLIREERPERVLEVGCGTGLLLFRVAPHSEEYVGTDFSQAALDGVAAQLEARGLDHVKLLRRAADDFDEIEAESFDTVLLNSVVQYFPSVAYLLRVLEGAVRVVSPGGVVIVGDVRSLPLLGMLHSRVILQHALESDSRTELRGRLEALDRGEEELVLAPELFHALKTQLPRVSGVEVRLKRGKSCNELTQFRYEVLLHVGDGLRRQVQIPWLEWDGQTVSLVRERLREEKPVLLGVRDVPNGRLWAERETWEWLMGDGGAETAGAWREALTGMERDGVDPEEIWGLSGEVPYEVDIGWSRSGEAGNYDVVFRRRGSGVKASAIAIEALGRQPWPSYGTDPLRQKRQEGFVGDLRRFLEGRLPDYMVPQGFMILDALPLTANGKVDRKALPELDGSRPQLAQAYVDPRTETEKLLAAIWREILGVERVGVHDSFFNLGGHSLLATQVIARVNAAFNVTVPLRELFEAPTIARLAQIVNAARTESVPAVPPLVPVPRDRMLPLSFAQQRLWFVEQYMPGTGIYNMPQAARLRGELGMGVLERSLNEIVRRHEALRTTFRAVRGDPCQVIASSVRLELPVVDIAGLDKKTREAEVVRLGRQEAGEAFDLSCGPLVRVRLLRLAEDEHVWLLTMHHIISDGWSMEILIRELGELYEAFERGTVAPLAELPIQYADFAVWQRQWLCGEVLEGQLSYWRDKLEGAPLELALPTDRPRPVVQTFRGARESLQLPVLLAVKLEELSRREGVTLFMTLLGAFQVLLCRCSAQHDIVVGTPIANRNRVEIEGLIGFFVNMLALRTDLSGNPTFREVLGRVREATLGGYANQDLPVERLVEELRLERKLDRPFVQATFALQNVSEERRKFSGLTLEALGVDRGLTQTDLTLSVQDTGKGLGASLRYSTDLFEARTIARMLEDYRALLEEVVADPERRIAALPPFVATEAVRRGQFEDIYEQSNLTRNQLLVWLGQKLHPQAPLYNLTTTLTIHGAVTIEHFRAAFASLVRSNDALRTVIVETHGLPQQRVLADLPPTVEYVDLSESSEPEDELEGWVRIRCQKVFELDRCLFDSVLIRLSPEKYVWYLNQHHLVSDGWSVRLMFTRMAELYERSVRGEPGEQKVQFPTYREYVDFERAYRRSSRYRRAEAYWREKLSEPIEPNAFYGKSVVGGSTRVARVSWELGLARSNELKATAAASLGGSEDIVLFSLFAGLLLVYLYRFSGNRRLSLGTLFHNRLSRFRETQGLFLQVLPLRFVLEEGETFSTLMDKVARELRRSVRHGQYAVSNPLQDRAYDVVLNYHNMSNEAHREFNGNPVDICVVPTGQGEESLALRVMDLSGSGDFSIDFDFRCDLFDEAQRDRTVRYFSRVLDAFLAEPQARVDRVDLLPREERERLVVEFNRTASPFPEEQALPQLFEAQVEKTPDRVAASCNGVSVTYAQLDARANQLARYLCEHGVGPDSLVGILMARSVDMLVSMLGILKAGGAYVPLDPGYPEQRLALMIADSGISILLTQPEFKMRERLIDPEANPDERVLVVHLDEQWAAIARESSGALPARAGPRNLSYVIYTSGSTGVPKGVMVEHRGMINHLHAKIAELALSEEDIVAQTASQCFDISVWQFLVGLLVGARVHVFEDSAAFNALSLPDAMAEQEITIFETVPSLLGAMLPYAVDAQLRTLRFLLVTGEAVPPELCRQWFGTGTDTPVVNAYGPTECSDDVTHHLIGAPPAQHVSCVPIGHPLTNTRLYIANREGQLQPLDVPGELWIGGAGVGRGYHGDCAKTAEGFVPDPFSTDYGGRLYRTGDLARHRSGGYIEFQGRIDHQVKVRGFRIELGEVEAVLALHPGVREVVVVVKGGAGESAKVQVEQLVAYVVSHEKPDVSELRGFLLERLPDYMVPAVFVMLDSLPLTPNGKVDRRLLPEPETSRGSQHGGGTPRDAFELQLVRVWQEVLGVAPIGIRDDFFELGGHSLLAVRLMARIEQQFGKSLPLAVLFQTPTIERLSQLLRSEIEIDGSPIVCIQSEGAKTPFFCVHPAHGNVLCYYELAQCMGQARPFYGLQAKGLDTEETSFKRLEELAAHYIGAIQQVQPRGPYLLGGWSLGGTVAFEMARQLADRGELVAELVLIDSHAPAVCRPVEADEGDGRRRQRTRLRAAAEHLLEEPEEIRVKLDSLLEEVKETGVPVPEVGLADARLYLNMMRLARCYTPQPCGAPATLLKARESMESQGLEDLGWRGLIEGGLSVHVLPGSHFDMIRKPHVQGLADQLQWVLDRADTIRDH